jgi:hypothetical protein
MAISRGRRSRRSTRARGRSELEDEVWAIWTHRITVGAPAYREQRREWAMRWARHAASLGHDPEKRATTMCGSGYRVGKKHVETFWMRPEIVRLSDTTRLAMWRAIADTWAAAGMGREPPRPPVPAQGSVVTSQPRLRGSEQ